MINANIALAENTTTTLYAQWEKSPIRVGGLEVYREDTQLTYQTDWSQVMGAFQKYDWMILEGSTDTRTGHACSRIRPGEWSIPGIEELELMYANSASIVNQGGAPMIADKSGMTWYISKSECDRKKPRIFWGLGIAIPTGSVIHPITRMKRREYNKIGVVYGPMRARVRCVKRL